MKTNKLLQLAIIAGILVAAAVWVQYNRERHRRPAREVGTPVVVELQKTEVLNAVACIEFVRADSTVCVTRVDGRWIAPDRYNYPVKSDEVRKFLLTLADLKVGQLVPGGEAELKRLELLEPALDTNGRPREGSGTLVRLADSNRTELAHLLIGKTRRRGGETGFADGRFVLARGRPALVGETFSSLPSRSVDWMETQLVDLFSSDIEQLTFTPVGKPPLVLTNHTGELRLVDLSTNEAMDSLKVSRLTGIVSWLRFVDIADPSWSPAQTGMDQPDVLTVRAKNGREFTVKIGKPTGTNAQQRFVAVAARYWPKPLPQASGENASEEEKKKHEEEVKKVKEENEKLEKEIQALNERTAQWVFIVEGSRFENLPRERTELLQAPATTSEASSTNAPPSGAAAGPASTNAPASSEAPPAGPSTEGNASTNPPPAAATNAPSSSAPAPSQS